MARFRISASLAPISPEDFILRGVKSSPCRADFVGASRDKVAPLGVRTDFSVKVDLIRVKNTG
jgi:hypothetical protein